MGVPKDFGRRATACVLVVTICFSTVPAVAAQDAILGTITVSGDAYSATSTGEWTKITATRPLVSGDRLKTEKGANLVADFHKLGVVGLYDDSEITVVDQGTHVAVEALRGKVAFYLTPQSNLRLNAGTATIIAGERKSQGYVEFTRHGAPARVAESDDVGVLVAGQAPKILANGDRVVLTGALAETPVKVEPTDQRKAGAMEPTPAKKKYAGISPLGWTAIAGVVAAVGIGVGLGAGGGGGGGGDDEPGSE